VPIIDTLAVMVRRIAAGHSPFKADRTHIHHRLLAIGFDHHEAVIAIYLAQASFFVVAWFMRYESDVNIAIAFALLALALLLPLTLANRFHWRIRAPHAGAPSSLSRVRSLIVWLAAPRRLPRWCAIAIAFGLLAFAVDVLLSDTRISRDTVLLAFVAALALIVSLVWSRKALEMPWIDKAAVYLCAVILVFVNEHANQSSPLSWSIIALIVVAVAIRTRLSSDRRFAVTPLDVLVVLVALLVPNLPDSIATPQSLGVLVAQLVALFYGIETLALIAQKQWRWISVITLSVLMLLGVSGM
jgi:UDP-GlcNAc:undecaprenyl-phosphate GlcNAc-1-phosphate transferase